MTRSKRYRAFAEKIEEGKLYPLAEAIALAKETGGASFDASVELHIHLGIDVKKANQNIRATVKLPHDIGVKRAIAVFASEANQIKAKDAGASIVGGEDLVKEIAESGKINFDVAIAEPAMMKVLGRIAKILGPKGLMPSPKSGTVTPDPASAVTELMTGKVAFRNDAGGNIHQTIGKVSMDANVLSENAIALLDTIQKAKPAEQKGTFLKSVTITTTMGPGIRVQV